MNHRIVYGCFSTNAAIVHADIHSLLPRRFHSSLFQIETTKLLTCNKHFLVFAALVDYKRGFSLCNKDFEFENGHVFFYQEDNPYLSDLLSENTELLTRENWKRYVHRREAIRQCPLHNA